MGWSDCGIVRYKGKTRRIGYGVVAKCDLPGCDKTIDRGLAYVCGGMHGEQTGRSCNGYFCEAHRGNCIPAEDEDIMANPESRKVRTIGVCDECYKSYKNYIRNLKRRKV